MDRDSIANGNIHLWPEIETRIRNWKAPIINLALYNVQLYIGIYQDGISPVTNIIYKSN